MAQKNRTIAFDALRAFAIVSVIGIHACIPYRDAVPITHPMRVFDDVLHYAVPLFLFISGVFIWARPLPSEPGAYRTFLAKRVWKIGLPFLAWSALYLALKVAESAAPATVLRQTPVLLVNGTWYHLYFIPMLLALYLLTPLAQAVGRHSWLLLFALLVGLRVVLLPELGAARPWLGSAGYPFVHHLLFNSPYMALGAWYGADRERIERAAMRWWPLLLFGGLGLLVAWRLRLTADLPGMLRVLVNPAAVSVLLLGLILAARSAEARLARRAQMWQLAGALAFGVYFVHPLLLKFAEWSATSLSAEWLLVQPAFTFAVIAVASALSYAVAYALSLSRRTAWLVGL